MNEFKVIESQEELDKIVKDRLERAEKKAREEMQGLIAVSYTHLTLPTN